MPRSRSVGAPVIRELPLRGALAALVLLFAGSSAPVPDAPQPATTNAPLPATTEAAAVHEFAEIERAMIFDLVARHRRSADDDRRRHLAEAVYRAAVEAGEDPLMVAAIVAKESSFRPRVVSRAGAVGLMQIRPFVGRDVAARTDLEWQGPETLHEPELNVRLGIHYYQRLVERFHGDVHIALAAYNRGPSRVSGELRQGTFSANGYARSVLRLYRLLDARRLSLLSARAGMAGSSVGSFRG